ncbi:hypothetical protein MTR67_030876 [Solanum verrucosum]|uniref:Uncharacterized protein n=1 Tax=Solanum verrucosum TaxID=315347 RepID=A0AAF0U1F2_SOLVR|nr:hypothetical protein MTR67_030876 [Solanum verrucosum]
MLLTLRMSKKELVHRLAQLEVSLVNSEDGGVIVQNESKSSHVTDVKESQENDPNLVELKKVVLEKVIEEPLRCVVIYIKSIGGMG